MKIVFKHVDLDLLGFGDITLGENSFHNEHDKQ